MDLNLFIMLFPINNAGIGDNHLAFLDDNANIAVPWLSNGVHRPMVSQVLTPNFEIFNISQCPKLGWTSENQEKLKTRVDTCLKHVENIFHLLEAGLENWRTHHSAELCYRFVVPRASTSISRWGCFCTTQANQVLVTSYKHESPKQMVASGKQPQFAIERYWKWPSRNSGFTHW